MISDLIYQNFGSFHCFLPLFLGPILNWLLQCFCRLFQNKPRHHHHSRRATSSSRHRPPGSPPSPGRAASHSLVCEQMDAVAADAFAAFIIVYTLFIVVFLPINLFVRTTRLSLVARINSWLRICILDKLKLLPQP